MRKLERDSSRTAANSGENCRTIRLELLQPRKKKAGIGCNWERGVGVAMMTLDKSQGEKVRPNPARYDGFPYGGDPGTADAVIVEAFFDPLCPDSRDAWPPLKQILLEYYPHLSLIVHPFPLPFHDNAFVACRALHIANKLNVSATYPLLELFFNYQEKYYNGPTKNLSRAAIVEDIARLGAQAVGNSLLPAFKHGFVDPQSDSATRISFKYGCTRGVFGTPFFFINGFLLPNGGSAIDYETWKSIIDPLLRDHGEKADEATSSL